LFSENISVKILTPPLMNEVRHQTSFQPYNPMFLNARLPSFLSSILPIFGIVESHSNNWKVTEKPYPLRSCP